MQRVKRVKKKKNKTSGAQKSYEINSDGLKVTESLSFSKGVGRKLLTAEITGVSGGHSISGLWVTNPSPPRDGTPVPALPVRTRGQGHEFLLESKSWLHLSNRLMFSSLEFTGMHTKVNANIVNFSALRQVILCKCLFFFLISFIAQTQGHKQNE